MTLSLTSPKWPRSSGGWEAFRTPWVWWGRNWNLLPPADIPSFLGARYLPQAHSSGAQPCISRKAVQGGAERTPTTCPLCMAQACPLHVLLWSGALLLSPLPPWPHWKEKMTKSVFFFNEMLLLEEAQASLVIAMSGPHGALWGAGAFWMAPPGLGSLSAS